MPTFPNHDIKKTLHFYSNRQTCAKCKSMLQFIQSNCCSQLLCFQTAGYFLGYVVFLALESADFCNKYLRSSPQDEGAVTLAGIECHDNLCLSYKMVKPIV